MQKLPSVLLEMDPRDPTTPVLDAHVELEVSIFADWQVVLRDLISLRKIGVEVVLAIKLGEGSDLAVERQGCADRLLHCFFVDDGKRSWKTKAHRTRERIGRRREVVGGAPAEHLALGEHLGVDLEPNDNFVACGDRHQPAARIKGDWSLRKSAAASNAKATCSIVSSRNPGAMICR